MPARSSRDYSRDEVMGLLPNILYDLVSDTRNIITMKRRKGLVGQTRVEDSELKVSKSRTRKYYESKSVQKFVLVILALLTTPSK